MKLLKKFLLILLILVGLLLGIGVLLIKQNTFELTEWKYLAEDRHAENIPERPNILLLVAEDMGARVGAFGDTLAHTPHIDQLAMMGVRYPNTFTTAGVCSPSRAALITGMHQISIGAQHMRTATRPAGAYLAMPPAEVKAFPELLRKAGYFTFNTAKLDYQFSGAMPGSGPFTIWDEENNTDLWRNRKAGQPFFGMLNFLETHESGVFTPLGNPPNSGMHFFLQLFRKLTLQGKVLTVEPEAVRLAPYYPDTRLVREDIARHYENIATMDALVGDVLDKLAKDGLLESTIVIWTTDHGDGLPRAKRELYDSGIKVPMVIYYPDAFRPKNVEVGEVDERLISFVDFAPTFLTLAQAPIPNFIQGENFMRSDTTAHRSYIFASRDRIDEVYDRQRAVRNDRFKYIRSWYPEQVGGHKLAFRDNMNIMKEFWKLKDASQLNEEQLIWFQAPGKERLFDTQQDPFELQDLSTDTAYTKELIQLRQEMDNWLLRTEDWSEVHEDEMVKKFQPQGELEKTPSPEFKQDGKLVSITGIHGASIGYQIEEGPWELYVEPFTIPSSGLVKAKAVRYGWEESEIAFLAK